MKAKIWAAPVVLVRQFAAAVGTAVDTLLFVADRDYEIVEVSESHLTAGSDGGAVTLDVKKSSSGTAFTAGTSVLASTFDLKSTASTPVRKTVGNGGIASSRVTRTLLAGQQLGIDFTGTMTAVAGGGITVVLIPLERGTY